MVDARKNGAADCNWEDILKERWRAAWIWITRQRKLSMESDRECGRYADGTLFGRSPALCVIFLYMCCKRKQNINIINHLSPNRDQSLRVCS